MHQRALWLQVLQMLELRFLSQVGKDSPFQGHSIIFKKGETDPKDSPFQDLHMLSSQEGNLNIENWEMVASLWAPACRK
jgi:hypothetical protein